MQTCLTDGGEDIEEEPPTLLNLDVDNIYTSANNHADAGTHFPIPVTILSGFLGSGKSTLIKYILNSPDHGKRIAIIENEYAPSVSSELGQQQQELTVESLIIKDGVTNQNLMSAANLMVELPNGCICCTVKDTLVSTLEMILTSATAKSIDYIIIEMSGMANPGGLASIFWLDEEDDEGQQKQPETGHTRNSTANKLRLDGIVTCVDAKHVSTQIQDTKDDGDEAAQQIAYADRIVLNKLDLMDNENDISQVIDTISSINPTAPILRTQYSQISDLSWILDANCFNAERVSKEYEQLNTQTLFCDPKYCSIASDTNSNQRCHHHHKHTSNIVTVVLNFQGSVDLNRVKTWMAKILWINQDKDSADYSSFDNNNLKQHEQQAITRELTMSIMRVKGILSIQHENSNCIGTHSNHSMCGNMSYVSLDQRKYVVQAVHDLWEILPCKTLKFQEEEERCCKVIVIGRFLDEQYLRDTFSHCLVS
jgi:G3E family GTPase